MQGPVFFGDLLHQIARATLRAGLVDRSVPESKLALWVLITTIENLSPTRLLFDQLSPAIWLRTGHSQGFLLDVLALRVIAAGRELSVAALLDPEVISALRAFSSVRISELAARAKTDEPLGGLAFGISVRRNCPEPAPLQVLGFCDFRRPLQFLNLYGTFRARPFVRNLTGVLAFWITRASREFSMPSPLDYHWLAALSQTSSVGSSIFSMSVMCFWARFRST